MAFHVMSHSTKLKIYVYPFLSNVMSHEDLHWIALALTMRLQPLRLHHHMTYE